MENISATIITRNEEQNLERCLNALQGIADEIVVVDSYSNDRTLEICRKYGCHITQREFHGFGSQRQFAVGLTSHKYVLSVDADEVIDEELRQHLLEIKKSGFDHRVYTVTIQNYFCGRPVRHSGFEPVCQVRLFDKRYAAWNLRDVADSVSFSDSVIPSLLPGTIHHYRCATLDEFIRKENRLASLQARIIAASSRKIGVFTPHIKALGRFLRSHFRELAWLDGSEGIKIAKHRSRTTFEAYRMARELLKES